MQQYGTIVFNYKGRTERVTTRRRAGHHQRASSRSSAASRRRSTSPRATARRTRPRPSATATATIADRARPRELHGRQGGARADGRGARRCRRSWSSPDRETDFFPPEIDALKKYLDKPGKLLLELDPPDKPDSPPLDQPDRARARLGHRRRQQRRRRRERHGTADRHRRVGAGRRRPTRRIRSRAVQLHHRLSAGASVVAGHGRRQRPHRADRSSRPSPRSWAETDIKSLLTTRRRSRSTSEGRQEGPDLDRGGGVGAAAAAPTPPKPAKRMRRSRKRASSVFGDSDFAANGTLGIPGNRDLFMNTIGWLSQQENLISIRPKEADDRRVTMTATQQTNIMLAVAADHPRLASSARASTPGGGGGRCAGCESTIALIVVLGGLGAYIYFVTSEASRRTTPHAEAGEGVRGAASRQDRRAEGHVRHRATTRR